MLKSYSLILFQQVPVKRLSVPIQPVFEIAVEDPQKVGDPVRGYTMYTVQTKVILMTWHEFSSLCFLDNESALLQILFLRLAAILRLPLAL